MPTQKDRIIDIAEEILRSPDNASMQQSELVKSIMDRSDIPFGTVNSNVRQLADYRPEIFDQTKEEKGGRIYYSLLQQDNNSEKAKDNVSVKDNEPNNERKEEDFYKSFAEYLKYGENCLDECTAAISCEDIKQGGKWENPDVVGVFKPDGKADVNFNPEIISAEIKIDSSQNALITAFGQACAYRLFSHKVYLAVPESGKNDRLEALCHIYGIGLVYFDHKIEDINPSIYKRELRAQKHSPDMFYAINFISGNIAKRLYPENYDQNAKFNKKR